MSTRSDLAEDLPIIKESIFNIAYYFAFALYFFTTVLNQTTFESFFWIPKNEIESYLQVAVLMLLLLKVLFQRIPFRTWITVVIVVAVGYISWRQANEGWLFWMALFVVSGKDVQVKRLAQIIFVESLLLLALTVTCAQLGIIENMSYVREGIIRYAMGYSHPNTFGLNLLMICLSFSVIRFGKNPLPDLIMLGFACVLNLLFANSRSTVLLCIAQGLLLLTFYYVKSPQRRSIIRCVFIGIGVSLILLSLYLMASYDPSSLWQSSLDEILSGRFVWSHAYYEIGGITLFGNDYSAYSPIYWQQGKPYAFVVDNAYSHIVLRYGLIPSTLFFLALFFLIGKIIKQERWDVLLFGLTLMLIYGFTETLGIRIESNFFLVSIALLVLYDDSPQSNSMEKKFDYPTVQTVRAANLEACGK